jgi:GWxTD domain-containing protein
VNNKISEGALDNRASFFLYFYPENNQIILHLFIKKHLPFPLLISLTVIFIAACSPSLNITGMDISSLYTGNKGNAIQLYQLYHINDSVTAISIELPSGLIQPDPGTRKYTKLGKLKYEIIGDGERVMLIDSASFYIADTADNQSYISHNWTFRATTGKDYFVKATYTVPGIFDDFVLLEYFSKKNHLCQTWYRFQSETGEFISGNITAYPQPVRMVTEDTTNRRFLVKVYSRNFQTPIPPFVEQYRSAFKYKPDSTFYLDLINGKTSYFMPNVNGFYFFQVDTTKMVGPSFFKMNIGFPKVTLHSLMRESLRYITSNKEFEQLSSYPIAKIAVDSFWIVNAGRPDLATELIRKYYKRVETANQLYTSFTDGWKTDRGMIYIVMGKPNKVFRSFQDETWIYGEYEDPRALKFYFTKAQNPFTNNDYVLDRDPYYKAVWYQNVQMWRR